MKVFYRETNALWKKKKRAQKLLLLHENHKSWVPDLMVAWLPQGQESTSRKQQHTCFDQGALIYSLGIKIQTGQYTYSLFLWTVRPWPSALEDGTQWIKLWWHNFTLKCIPKIIWAMDRWTICGKANMVTCLLKNSGDGFTVCIIKFFQLSVCFKCA